MKSRIQSSLAEAEQPPATPVSDDIIFWRASAKAPVVYYVRFFGELACKVNVLSAHDAKLVESFLRELSVDQLRSVGKDRPLGRFESRALAGTPFRLRAVAHPSIARGAISTTLAFMDGMTYTTFPTSPCEFTNEDTPEEAAFRMAKVVRWSDWRRPPAPALSARFHRVRTGIKSTGGKRMGVFPLSEVEDTISHLATEEGFIEIENYERRLVRIEHDKKRYEVTQDENRWAPRTDAVIPWLRVFAIKGLEAADKERQTYVD